MSNQSTAKGHWWNRRRMLATFVAIALVVTAVMAGTFAWNAISQKALNEVMATNVNPGGRLHDDFDGDNLDVYVENYGTSPIYAKVQLREYMETGDGASLKGAFDPNGTQLGGGKGKFAVDTNNHATPFKAGALIGDSSTWSIHTPSAAGVNDCGKEGTDKYHDNWTWAMGGQKIYMPTFNKDNESLASDITGLDTTGISSALYGSRVSDPEGGGTPTLGKDGSHGQYALGEQSTGATKYASKTTSETHYAKNTLSGTVITMAAWQAAGSKPGSYWVIADD
ncbi:MAG: hypothetical protein LBH87_01565, partial [Coriobacteriales bacterium]|nr:hypothetical protein [Coriobacteriales bacterium]